MRGKEFANWTERREEARPCKLLSEIVKATGVSFKF